MNKKEIRIYYEDLLILIQQSNENQAITKPENWLGLILEAHFRGSKVLSIFNTNLEGSVKIFRNKLIYIEAGGGLVSNNLGSYLFIFRKGKWDLPKGKLEKKETAEEGALRECREECGLQQLDLGKKITETFHLYPIQKRMALKRTHWFAMHSKQEDLIPQIEEEITEVGWKRKEEILELMKNTYPSIQDVIRLGIPE